MRGVLFAPRHNPHLLNDEDVEDTLAHVALVNVHTLAGIELRISVRRFQEAPVVDVVYRTEGYRCLHLAPRVFTEPNVIGRTIFV
jgi:hypothetical protein